MKRCAAVGLLFCLLLPCAVVGAQERAPAMPLVVPAGRCGFQHEAEGDREKARQQLGISVPQQDQLTRLYAEAEKREKAVQKQLHDLYAQRHALYASYVIDHAQEREIRKKIEQMHSQLLQIHEDTENGLRKILTREQFERLNAMLKEHRRNRRHGPERQNGEERSPRLNDREHGEEKAPPPPE